MKRFAFALMLALCLAGMPATASSINKITLAELQSRADIIVMGKVSKLVKTGSVDTVTVEVAVGLKGDRPNSHYTFTLVTRGGLKDFDPALKVGDSGVFFLKSDTNGKTVKAYWGGVAIFPKNHFDVKKTK